MLLRNLYEMNVQIPPVQLETLFEPTETLLDIYCTQLHTTALIEFETGLHSLSHKPTTIITYVQVTMLF